MKQVWLLWGSDTETPWLEGVYVDKVKAEADMRMLKIADAWHEGRARLYNYWLQEKEITR